jgi:hypothetical protein
VQGFVQGISYTDGDFVKKDTLRGADGTFASAAGMFLGEDRRAKIL